ncbi:hypothetical protein [Microcoleus phage My-WqHQDG]|nr:hypothetical protein [Microcoleus phage My-WqHQDG]
MKTLLITSKGAVPHLLPGHLEHSMNWLSWETPGHGTRAEDRARARVQYILDMGEAIRNSEPVCNPLQGGRTTNPQISFSPTYCPESKPTLIVGIDMDIPQVEDTDCPVIYPAIEVHYAMCVYYLAANISEDMVSTCTYLVPYLHPSEHNLPPDGTGPFTLMDMLGGILCTHVEGTEPVHMLRELIRPMGHLPHEFLTTGATTNNRQ